MNALRCLAFLLPLLLTGCAAPAGQRIDLEEAIYSAAAAVPIGEAVDLTSVLGQGWDRIVVFDGEPAAESIRDGLGFDWPGYSSGMGDGTTIALIKDQAISAWAYIPAINDAVEGRLVEVAMDHPWIEVDPADLHFIVLDRPGSGPVWLCYRHCPETW